jgi:hypothetical protein
MFILKEERIETRWPRVDHLDAVMAEHRLENIGKKEPHVISMEIKNG